MAGSVNKHIIVGNLGGDPEVKVTGSGRKYGQFSVATSETWRDKDSGERKERTAWHRVVVWNENLVKVVEQYLKKGAKVYIEGPALTRKWTDQGGVDRYVTEIVLQGFNCTLTMLDGRREGVPAPSESDHAARPASSSSSSRSSAGSDDMNDDIPF